MSGGAVLPSRSACGAVMVADWLAMLAVGGWLAGCGAVLVADWLAVLAVGGCSCVGGGFRGVPALRSIRVY